MIALHDYPLSTACYQARLLLAFLDAPYRRVAVDCYPGGARGALPVLQDQDQTLDDIAAILIHLATVYDPERRWYPPDPGVALRIAAWLSPAANRLESLTTLRLQALFGPPDAAPTLRARARRALQMLEDHLSEIGLSGQRWIAAQHPTIADVACFPDLATASEAGMSLASYPAIWRWIERFKRLPGFIVMPGVFRRPSLGAA